MLKRVLSESEIACGRDDETREKWQKKKKERVKLYAKESLWAVKRCVKLKLLLATTTKK